ncbi:MAG: GNAT family N-acetyltransferase [Clostridiales bacterium]|jgi:ribosomal protein S18 acetylase RimI-like enzyme|nr:GNAT family N-acetyltransferase [Clostridiales bacterium]
MTYEIRKARKDERHAIAKAFAYSYKDLFLQLQLDLDLIANAFDSGVRTEKFWVAVKDGDIIGIAACTDRDGRAVYPNEDDFIKYFGPNGASLCDVFKNEFTKKLTYPKTTGYIEFVGVLEEARGHGISKEIMSEIIKQSPQYDEFVLDVANNNIAAIILYQRLGFVEFDRIPAPNPEMMGFESRIYMKLKKEE